VRVPPLVGRAHAAGSGAVGSVDDEAGSLLHVLAAGRGVCRAAEIGTGTGVGAAWIAAALPPGAPLFTAERDEPLAAAASALFSDDPDVRVLVGDWRLELGAQAPFDLIHVADEGAMHAVDEVVSLAAPRATLVVSAPSREGGMGVMQQHAAWLDHPRLDAIVVSAGGASDLLVAVVRG